MCLYKYNTEVRFDHSRADLESSLQPLCNRQSLGKNVIPQPAGKWLLEVVSWLQTGMLFCDTNCKHSPTTCQVVVEL